MVCTIKSVSYIIYDIIAVEEYIRADQPKLKSMMGKKNKPAGVCCHWHVLLTDCCVIAAVVEGKI